MNTGTSSSSSIVNNSSHPYLNNVKNSMDSSINSNVSQNPPPTAVATKL